MSPARTKKDLDRLREVLVDAAYDAMFQTAADGVIQWTNRRCADMLGYDGPERMIGMQARDLYLTPRARDRMIREVEDKGHVANFTAQLKRRDGRRIVMEMNVSLLRDRRGKPTGIVGIGRDVTRRVAAQKAKRRQLEFSQRVLDTIPACVFAVDLEGSIIWVNGAACRLCGAGPSELQGRNIFSDAPAWMQHQADEVRGVLERGQMCTIRRSRITVDNGEPYYMSFTIVPTRDLGEISGAIIEGIDVTETVEMYSQMLQAERRFRTLFDSAPEAYLSFERDGTVVDCNETACKVLGYRREQIIGQPVDELYMPDDRAKARSALDASTGDPLRPVEVRLRNYRGRSVPCHLMASVLRDDAGQIVTAFAVHRLKRRRRKPAAT